MTGPVLPSGWDGTSSTPKGKAEERPVAECLAESSRNRGAMPELTMHWLKEQRVGCGLRNLGNSCFLNSVLQSLTYVPPLGNLCLRYQHRSQCPFGKSGKSEDSAKCAYCLLEKRIKRSLETRATEPEAPNWIWNRLDSMFSKHLVKGRQEDAHEFLRCLLDAVERAVLVGRHDSKPAGVVQAPETEISYLFGGMLQSQVKCKSCGGESNTYDPFHDLSLELGTCKSVDQALQLFTAPEHLSGENAYSCERCKRKTDACKRMTVHEVPNVLVIHLKRFDGVFGGKISRHITFHEHLSLAPYLSAGSPDRLACLQDECSSATQRPSPDYSLSGVLVHDGFSAHAGHYYTCVRAPDGHWFEMNDTRVSPMRLLAVLAEEAYLLFYVRSAARPPKQYQNVPELAGGQPVSPSLKRTLPEGGWGDAVAPAKYSKSCDSDESVSTQGPPVSAPAAASAASSWMLADDDALPPDEAAMPGLPSASGREPFAAFAAHSSNGCAPVASASHSHEHAQQRQQPHHGQQAQHAQQQRAPSREAQQAGRRLDNAQASGMSAQEQQRSPLGSANTSNGLRGGPDVHAADAGLHSRADSNGLAGFSGWSPVAGPAQANGRPAASGWRQDGSHAGDASPQDNGLVTPLQQPGYGPGPTQHAKQPTPEHGHKAHMKFSIKRKGNSRGRLMASMGSEPTGKASAAKPSSSAKPPLGPSNAARSAASTAAKAAASRPASNTPSAAAVQHPPASTAALQPVELPVHSRVDSTSRHVGSSNNVAQSSHAETPMHANQQERVNSTADLQSRAVRLPTDVPTAQVTAAAQQAEAASAPTGTGTAAQGAALPARVAPQRASQSPAQPGSPAREWHSPPGRDYPPEAAEHIFSAISSSRWRAELKAAVAEQRDSNGGQPLDDRAKQAILAKMRTRLPHDIKSDGVAVLEKELLTHSRLLNMRK